MPTNALNTARTSLILGAAAALSLAACADLGDDADGDEAAAVEGTNGLVSSPTASTAINGLSLTNGLVVDERPLQHQRSLTDQRALQHERPVETNGLMTTDGGRKTVAYLVKCALAANDTLVKQDAERTSVHLPGGLGLCPQWKNGGIATDRACQNMVSACMMAFVNTAGVHIPIWLDSESPTIGWGVSPNYPKQEGTFFGNIMMTGNLRQHRHAGRHRAGRRTSARAPASQRASSRAA